MRLNIFIDTEDGYILGESLIEIGESIGQGNKSGSREDKERYYSWELIYPEGEIPRAPAQGVRYTASNKTDIRETWKRFGWTPSEGSR